MSSQLNSLRYYQIAQATKQTQFYWKFKEDEILAQERIWKTLFLKLEHYDLAISDVSYYGYFTRHSSIN